MGNLVTDKLKEFCNDRAAYFNSLGKRLFVFDMQILCYHGSRIEKELADDIDYSIFPPTKQMEDAFDEALKERGKSWDSFCSMGAEYDFIVKSKDIVHVKVLQKAREIYTGELNKLDIKKWCSAHELKGLCIIVRDLFRALASYGLNEPAHIQWASIKQVEGISILLTSRAHEWLGYFTAKMERAVASVPGIDAKAQAMEARVKEVINGLKAEGLQTNHGLEISKRHYHKIFQQLEIYSDPTKRKYKKIAEEKLFGDEDKDGKIIIRK